LKNKHSQILLPPIFGLIVAFIASTLLELALDKYYFPYDPDFGFDLSMYASMYIMFFIPLLFFASVFQYFVALKIWKKHLENKKIFKLKLWQIICLSCLIYAIPISIYQCHSFLTLNHFILIFARRVLFVLTYWFTNYFTLKVLRQFFDTMSVVKNV
jgi:hypothetical protein